MGKRKFFSGWTLIELEQRHSSAGRGLAQVFIQAGQRQSLPHGQFQIGGVIRGKAVFSGQRERLVKNLRPMGFFNFNGQALNDLDEPGGSCRMQTVPVFGHGQDIGDFQRPNGGHQRGMILPRRRTGDATSELQVSPLPRQVAAAAGGNCATGQSAESPTAATVGRT